MHVTVCLAQVEQVVQVSFVSALYVQGLYVSVCTCVAGNVPSARRIDNELSCKTCTCGYSAKSYMNGRMNRIAVSQLKRGLRLLRGAPFLLSS